MKEVYWTRLLNEADMVRLVTRLMGFAEMAEQQNKTMIVKILYEDKEEE